MVKYNTCIACTECTTLTALAHFTQLYHQLNDDEPPFHDESIFGHVDEGILKSRWASPHAFTFLQHYLLFWIFQACIFLLPCFAYHR